MPYYKSYSTGRAKVAGGLVATALWFGVISTIYFGVDSYEKNLQKEQLNNQRPAHCIEKALVPGVPDTTINKDAIDAKLK